MTKRHHPGNSLTENRLLADTYMKLFEEPASEFRWETGEEFFLAVARAAPPRQERDPGGRRTPCKLRYA